MKLSIITINRNNASGLSRTIESVVSQTWKDFEYIVIDGASSDESVEVIKKYDSSITTWVSEPDSGIYNAMNKGIRRASGEYCLFLNSGDYLADEHVLERVSECRYASDVVIFSVLCLYKNASYYLNPPRKISLYTFLKGNLPHPSSFIRRSLFASEGEYRENYRIISDWCFFVDALILHNASYEEYDILVSIFDGTGESISTNNADTIIEEKKDYLTKYFPRVWEDYDVPEHYLNTVYFFDNDAPMILKCLFKFAFKVINRLFKLRNNQGRLLSVRKIKY